MIPERKEVVIIGNGPSAITLSYFLAGNWPYYNGNHPNLELHQRIQASVARNNSLSTRDGQMIDLVSDLRDGIDIEDRKHSLDFGEHNSSISIIEAPLDYICSAGGGLEGRSINPVSVLFDSLQHPDADVGSSFPSCLEWRNDSRSLSIDHVVLGQGDIGGSWDKLAEAEEILTVSFADWMQLPGLPIDSTMKIPSEVKTGSSGKRISLANVSKYFKEYVNRQGLEKYFKNHTVVTSVKMISPNDQNDDITKSTIWKVSGWQEGKGPFEYITPRVVLATGNSDVPNRLKVKGEELPFVLDSFMDLEKIVSDTRNSNLHDPVVIVGSGLTAADAIIACKQYNIPVRHVFRRHPEDPALIFNQLPENLYPEYHAVHARMKGNRRASCQPDASVSSKTSPCWDYNAFPMHAVSEVRKNKEVVINNLLCADQNGQNGSSTKTMSRTTIKASYVLSLIGRRADLSFIQSKKVRDSLPTFPGEPISPRTNPLRIMPWSHECVSVPGMYAMGPLVGDNFVRFVQGAALAVCYDIVRKVRMEMNSSTNIHESKNSELVKNEHCVLRVFSRSNKKGNGIEASNCCLRRLINGRTRPTSGYLVSSTNSNSHNGKVSHPKTHVPE